MDKTIQARPTDIYEAIEVLRKGYNKWQIEQDCAEMKLYSLLEDCLYLLYQIQSDSSKRSAFEQIVGSKKANRISLEARIIKTVFGGDVKSLRFYSKVLKTAARNDIGKGDNIRLSEWIKQNEGVNQAVRSRSEKRWEAWRKFRILIGKHCERLGFRYKQGLVHSKELLKTHDEPFAILVVPNKETAELDIKAITGNQALLDRMYDELGGGIIRTRQFKDNLFEFLEWLKIEGDADTLEVLEVLEDDLKRIGNLPSS